MALSDCPKCWDTPCTCGYEYRDWSDEQMMRVIRGAALHRMQKKQAESASPDPVLEFVISRIEYWRDFVNSGAATFVTELANARLDELLLIKQVIENK